MKTQMSRFHIHDDLSAPEESLPLLKAAMATAGQLPNFLGVLAGSPAVLRAYARFRSELRHGALPLKTQQRVALAVAQHDGSEYWLATLQRTAREAGLGRDELARARGFEWKHPREAGLLAYRRGRLDAQGAAPPAHLLEEAREADWSDEQILEAAAHVALGQLSALVAGASDVPRDGSHEEGRLEQAA